MMGRLKKWLIQHNINYKKYLIIFYVVFVMIPLMLFLSTKDRNSDVVTKTTASVLLLALFIVFFIYDFRKKLAGDWGIMDVNVGTDLYSSPAKELKTAKNVKIMASEDLDKILDILTNSDMPVNCECRILLFNPYSPYNEILPENKDYISFAEKIENVSKRFEFKYYSTQPLDNLIIIDDFVYVYPKTQKLQDGRRLFRKYSGKKKGLMYYSDVFKHVWEHPCYERAERR